MDGFRLAYHWTQSQGPTYWRSFVFFILFFPDVLLVNFVLFLIFVASSLELNSCQTSTKLIGATELSNQKMTVEFIA